MYLVVCSNPFRTFWMRKRRGCSRVAGQDSPVGSGWAGSGWAGSPDPTRDIQKTSRPDPTRDSSKIPWRGIILTLQRVELAEDVIVFFRAPFFQNPGEVEVAHTEQTKLLRHFRKNLVEIDEAFPKYATILSRNIGAFIIGYWNTNDHYSSGHIGWWHHVRQL